VSERQIILWRIKGVNKHNYMIEFWSKPDRSNALTTVCLTLDDAEISQKVKNITGKVHFDLEEVK
jgi:hypothetical protein